MLGEPDLALSVTAVRVPMFFGYGAERHARDGARRSTAAAAAEVLRAAPRHDRARRDGDRVSRRRPRSSAPTRRTSAASATTRRAEHGLALWIALDNVRKGAALNAVQIAELAGPRATCDGAPRDAAPARRRVRRHGVPAAGSSSPAARRCRACSSGRSRPRCASRSACAAPAAPTPACTRAGRWRRSAVARAPDDLERLRAEPQRAHARRRRGPRGRASSTTPSTRAAHARSRVYEYRILHAPAPSPFWRRWAWHVPRAARRRRDGRGGGAARRRARLRRVPRRRRRAGAHDRAPRARERASSATGRCSSIASRRRRS